MVLVYVLPVPQSLINTTGRSSGKVVAPGRAMAADTAWSK
jgi:hypothetical protein